MSEPKAPASFQTMLKVKFGDVDPAGIVYFPRIYEYLHDVFEELWEDHVGQRYYHLLLEQKIGFPLVHSDVDFSSPLRFGDRATVKVTCFKLGESSLGLRYRILMNDRLCVEARQTTVCVHVDTMDKFPMPESFRTSFQKILEEDTQ
jgi:4-hydroxybenzoyl-CoA thioesterase